MFYMQKMNEYNEIIWKKSLGECLEEERYLDECIKKIFTGYLLVSKKCLEFLGLREGIPRKSPSGIPAKSARQISGSFNLI